MGLRCPLCCLHLAHGNWFALVFKPGRSVCRKVNSWWLFFSCVEFSCFSHLFHFINKQIIYNRKPNLAIDMYLIIWLNPMFHVPGVYKLGKMHRGLWISSTLPSSLCSCYLDVHFSAVWKQTGAFHVLSAMKLLYSNLMNHKRECAGSCSQTYTLRPAPTLHHTSDSRTRLHTHTKALFCLSLTGGDGQRKVPASVSFFL